MNPVGQESLKCEIIGLYPVAMTEQELREKMKAGIDYSALEFDYLLSLFESLYLFEVMVSDSSKIKTFIDEITQETDDGQAPYRESFFDESGTRLIDEPNENSKGKCRLCFYLHYVNLEFPLEIAGKSLPLPVPSSMPKRLADLLEYEPPN